MSFDAGPWFRSAEAAPARRSDLWYRDPAVRFVPEGDFELLACRFGEDGCRIDCRPDGADPTSVALTALPRR